MTSQISLVSPSGIRVKKKIKLVPPDGGWGWMVLLGTALTNTFNQAMLSLFSLLYGDALEAMGHRTKGAALVVSTTLFVTNFAGPIAGVVLRFTSPRFTAVAGACFCSTGIFLSGLSTNIWHLVFTFGILLGIGLGFIQNSSFVAINSYFKLKKSQAVGLANVGTGVGQTLMPHLARYLLEDYGFQGACLMLSGLSLHGIVGTLLIQPVEWHMKKIEEDVIVDESMKLLEEKHKNIVVRKDSQTNGFSEKESSLSNNNGVEKNGKVNGKGVSNEKKSVFRKIYEVFDMSLLTSARFINTLFGIALSYTSIQNFSMLFPFYLQKVAMLDKRQTATCMSAVAAADIMGRLILPVVQDKLRIKARWMMVMVSAWIIVVRQILAYQVNMTALVVLAALYGFGRSMVIVARNISISENCRMDQVPAAVGLGMLAIGIGVPPAGYFLGWIRDYSESYIVCITAQNAFLLVLLITWIPDLVLLWREEKRMKMKELDNINLS